MIALTYVLGQFDQLNFIT